MKNSISYKKLRSIFRNKKQDEIFCSQSFSNALNSLANMVSNRYNLKTPIRLILKKKGTDHIAYTDNREIVIFLQNPITKMVNSLEDKYLTFLGMLGHECGHLLYTNFNILKKVDEGFKKHTFYVSKPKFQNKQLENNFNKIFNKIFSDDVFINGFSSIFHEIQNILEDKYVNERIKKTFPGTFKNGIIKIYDLMFSVKPNEKNELDNMTFAHFLNFVHEYLEFGNKTEAAKLFSEFKDDEFISFLDNIENLDSMDDRIRAVYVICAYGAEYLLKIIDDVSELRELFNELNNSSTRTEIGEGEGEFSDQGTPNNQTTPNSNQGNENGGADKNSNQSNLDSSYSSNGNRINHSDEASKAAKDKLPITISEILDGYIRSLMNNEEEVAKDLIQQERTYEVFGENNLSFTFSNPKKNKQKYNEYLAGLKPFIKRLVRGFDEIIDEKSNGIRSRNLLAGTKINPSATATSNGKVFIKNKLPEDVADVAVCVLIDQSGSMHGQRIDSAKSTSIILSEFCETLDIPYAVFGHNYGRNIILYNYTDFEDNISSKYSISNMSASGCNRDGSALKYAIKALTERVEPSKLLFIISDGWPSAYNSRSTAEKDIKEAVSLAKKNGILLSAMAIGEDKDAIQKLYGDAFIDISDLTKLPKKVINKIKRYIS